MNQVKFMENVGKVATVTAVAMYVSYFPQIMHNLAYPGTGDWIQPLVAAINCTLWVAYGLFKEHRDIPVALANAPGIFFGLAAAIYSSYVIFYISISHRVLFRGTWCDLINK